MRLIDADELINNINQDIKAFERMDKNYFADGVICGLTLASKMIKLAPKRDKEEFFKMTAEDEKEISGLLEEGEE